MGVRRIFSHQHLLAYGRVWGGLRATGLRRRRVRDRLLSSAFWDDLRTPDTDGLTGLLSSMMDTYDATLESWSRALELRDRGTHGHMERTVDMTVELARFLGMQDGELIHLRRGAILHDIGKMGVPDSILLKNGPLTMEEWEVMRRHPTIASELLSPIPFLKSVLEIPYYHHERWDGNGYPCGLKGEQIPLAARIFAVVDVWDALTSDRPYRKAWSVQQAIEYIRQEAGRHFDPAVVEAFLKIVEENLHLDQNSA